MLKKHNKLIMLLVLVSFMFTMVGSAGAASYSDVTGTSAESAAIYRLSGLGVLDGYPDGTFGPEKTITRAEFAKIACVTAGLKSVASGMGGTASPFSDVATDHWANGWINVAAAQGYVKGDPAGTFRPEDQITQAEVVTVLLRLLGYNDNLAGEWPSDYIAKAANLGVLDDVTFVSGQAASRGVVAILASATLDEKVVVYVASDNLFNEATKTINGQANQTYSLLYDKFDKSTKADDAVLVYDLDLSGGKQAIKVVDPAYDLSTAAGIAAYEADVDAGKFIKYTLADGCVISGATSILGVAGRFADYTLNKDKEVVSIEVKNNDDYKVITGIKPGDIERVSSNTLKLKNGKSYDIASYFNTYSSSFPGVIFTQTGYKAGDLSLINVALSGTYNRAANTGFLGTATPAAVAPLPGMQTAAKGDKLDAYMQGVALAAETVDLVLDDDDDIAYVNLNVWPTAPNPTLDTVNVVGIVDKVSKNTGKVSLKNGGSYTLDEEDDDNQVIVKNGKIVGLSDLAENDMVWFLNKYNTDMVIAMSITAKGTFDSYEETTFLGKAMTKKVIVGDKTYDVIKGGGFISTDEADTFSTLTNAAGAITSDLEDGTGGEATVYLSPSMTVAAILTGEGDGASTKYGVINDATVSSLVNGKVTNSIEVMLADGSLATYAPDEDSEININGAGAIDLIPGTHIGSGKVLDKDVFISLTLNSDGYINLIKTGVAIKDYVNFGKVAIDGDEDELTVQISGNSYDAEGAIIFNTNLSVAGGDDDEVDTVALSEFMDNADSGIAAGANDVIAVVDGGAIKYLVFDDPAVLGSDNNYAMVTGRGTDSNGAFVRLMTTGDPVKYTVKSAAVAYAKGKVVLYDIVSGDVKLKAWTGWNNAGAATLTIDDISGKVFTINGTNYAVDADTLYFDFTDDDPIIAEKGDFAADDKVLIYQEKVGGAIDAIVLID